MSNAIHLKELIKQDNSSVLSREELAFLSKILNEEELKENINNPLSYTVDFALSQAKSRLEKTQKLNRKTYGIPKLISNLSKLNFQNNIAVYNLSSTELTGACFVYNNIIQGFEFVEKGEAISKKGLDLDLLTKYK